MYIWLILNSKCSNSWIWDIRWLYITSFGEIWIKWYATEIGATDKWRTIMAGLNKLLGCSAWLGLFCIHNWCVWFEMDRCISLLSMLDLLGVDLFCKWVLSHIDRWISLANDRTYILCGIKFLVLFSIVSSCNWGLGWCWHTFHSHFIRFRNCKRRVNIIMISTYYYWKMYACNYLCVYFLKAFAVDYPPLHYWHGTLVCCWAMFFLLR